MSIPSIQRRRVFEEVTRTLHSSGERPELVEIMREVSEYFSENPAGLPLRLPLDYISSRLPSHVDKFNTALAHVITNIDVLYENSEEQTQDIMLLNTLLRTNLERLRSRRQKLINNIDDYLFSLYNTDGYYFSVSDGFSDLSLTDLSLTSSYVDTVGGKVALPTVSHLTKRVTPEVYQSYSIQALVDGSSTTYETMSPFQGAFDGLTNTTWHIEIETDSPTEVMVSVVISLGSTNDPVTISRIELEPYGVTPVQAWVEMDARNSTALDETAQVDFGSNIKTSAHKMTFINSPVDPSKVYLRLRKTDPDYTLQSGGTTKYRYIFGLKNIEMTEHVYDNESVFVTKPLSLPDELVKDNVIDAVSLVTVDETPINTELKYFVASDVDTEEPTLGDFNWKPIEKIDSLNPQAESIVRFDGAIKFLRNIRSNPLVGDLQLINFDNNNKDLRQHNPSPVIVDTQDIYRLAEFDDDVLVNSLLLEEGVNTCKTVYVDQSPLIDEEDALGLAFWRDYLNETLPSQTTYSRIDAGNEFFYGGDIGEDEKYVYVETYLESDTDQETMLKKFIKVDPNSRIWPMKVYLNGIEIADIPVGTDEIVIPWKFKAGLNHVAMTMSIPRATRVFPHPYIGTIDLMGDNDLYDFGTVKLATWKYVDFFKMEYNETGQPFTFTMYNGEIVSRRKPTDNFRISFSKASDQAPDSIRLRIDLSRDVDSQYVTPSVDLYRLRYIYQ